MRTLAQLQAHLREVIGYDIDVSEGWSRYEGNDEGRPGGWIHREAVIDPGVQIGEDAVVYGGGTYLTLGTSVEDDSVVGPLVRTYGDVRIAGGAHVTGESTHFGDRLHPTFLRNCKIFGKGTWVSQCDLTGTHVGDGAWAYQCQAGPGAIYGRETVAAQCALGDLTSVGVAPDDPDLPEEQEPEAKEFEVVGGAKLVRCTVGPGVIVDRSVDLQRRDLYESHPSFTSKETLIELGLGPLHDLEEEEDPFEETDFTASRNAAKAAPVKKPAKDYVM